MRMASPTPYPTQRHFAKWVGRESQRLWHAITLYAENFPNLKYLGLQSRSYAGYASTKKHPEPWAYWQSYVVQQVLGIYSDKTFADPFPFVDFIGDLWTNGTEPRASV